MKYILGFKDDLSSGKVITDPRSHEEGSICRTPEAHVDACECPNAKWYVDNTSEELSELPEHLESAGDANDQPPEVRSRLVLRANKLIYT